MTLLEALPKPRHPEFYEHLLADDAASDYAEMCLNEGIIKDIETAKLAEALQTAALFYFEGAAFTEGLKANRQTARLWNREGKEAASKGLEQPPPQRPTEQGDRGIIWVMALIWNLGAAEPKGWTADDGSSQPAGHFQRFCNGWIEKIDKASRPA